MGMTQTNTIAAKMNENAKIMGEHADGLSVGLDATFTPDQHKAAGIAHIAAAMAYHEVGEAYRKIGDNASADKMDDKFQHHDGMAMEHGMKVTLEIHPSAKYALIGAGYV